MVEANVRLECFISVPTFLGGGMEEQQCFMLISHSTSLMFDDLFTVVFCFFFGYISFECI